MTKVDISAIVNSSQFKQACGNSFLAAGTGTVISILTAYIFALGIVRSNIRCKEAFSVFAALPMLIPSISHGMGLVLLLGSNGIVTRLLRLNSSIYGFTGIVLGSVFYAFPVAFLMLSDILKY
jgi:iron(III) transport system permease protein